MAINTGVRVSLKLKATVFISLMILGVGALLSWYFLSRSETVLREELQKRALVLGTNLAHNSHYGLLTEDAFILGGLIDGILREENVVYVAITDAEGDVIADRFREDLGGSMAEGAAGARALAAATTVVSEEAIHYFDVADQNVHPASGIYHVVAPVLPSQEAESAQESELAAALGMLGESPAEPEASGPLGTVQIILSLERLEQDIANALRTGVGITLMVILVGIVIAFVFVRYVLAPVQEMAGASTYIAAGDLTQRVDSGSADEIGLLASAFNEMTEALSRIIGQTQRSGVEITSSVNEITASGKQLEATMSQQASSTNEVVATAREISATSQELLSTMGEVSSKAEDTVSSADAGRQGLTRMETSMQQMEEATQSISSKLADINQRAADITSVVVTITKVADQTNLLSLNAAIEAEKAGEYGVGFSVVAREIRRLADQTAVATLDIEQTVKEMGSAVSAGVMSMDKFSEQVRQGAEEIRNVGVELAGVIEQVHALTPRFDAVAEGMDAQTQGAVQISDSMIQLNDGAKQTVDSLREINRVLAQLRTSAHDMQSEIARFKLS